MPLDKCVCGFVAAAAAPAPVKSAWHSRWDFIKRNVPAIISIASVILNVVIISRLIPDMQSSISVMQGQAQSVQTQVNAINGLLLGVNDKINDANIKIDTFNGLVSSVTQTLNATQTNILAFSQQTQADLVVMHSSAAATLSGFHNASIGIERQLNASQSEAAAILNRVAVASAALDAKATQYSDAANASLQLLMQTNASVISGVEAVRDDFTNRIVPAITADLQSLNMSSAISALAAIDPPHYVGNATNGLGTIFQSSWLPYDAAERRPRFWRDRGMVYLEGLWQGGAAGTVPACLFTLPPAYRIQTTERYFPVVSLIGRSSSVFAEIDVRQNGEVWVLNANVLDLSMDGIAFSTASDQL